jgi:hypothetical protein
LASVKKVVRCLCAFSCTCFAWNETANGWLSVVEVPVLYHEGPVLDWLDTAIIITLQVVRVSLTILTSGSKSICVTAFTLLSNNSGCLHHHLSFWSPASPVSQSRLIFGFFSHRLTAGVFVLLDTFLCLWGGWKNTRIWRTGFVSKRVYFNYIMQGEKNPCFGSRREQIHSCLDSKVVKYFFLFFCINYYIHWIGSNSAFNFEHPFSGAVYQLRKLYQSKYGLFFIPNPLTN